MRAEEGKTKVLCSHLWGLLGLVPGSVQVAAVHLRNQLPSKLLGISKASQAGEICSDICDDDCQVCVKVTFWVPALQSHLLRAAYTGNCLPCNSNVNCKRPKQLYRQEYHDLSEPQHRS